MVCTFLVKSADIAFSPLGIRYSIAYAETEAFIPGAARAMPEHVATDPVFSAFELPLRRTFFPLGYPLDLETNSPDVLLAAEESWGAQEQMFNRDPVRMCLGVSENDSEFRAPIGAIRAREHLMSIVADAENFLVCDFEQGFAFGWVTRNTAADRALLRHGHRCLCLAAWSQQSTHDEHGYQS